MIDPPKATKGRRMSTKTRKKSPKKSARKPSGSSAPKPPRARSAATATAASQRAASKQLRKTDALAPRKGVLAEGAKAPAFRLPRDGGGTVSLSDYAGRKLVVFFYPRADTPGCTREAIDFTRLADAFAQARTAILGISADPLKVQESFRDKHRLSTPLASDEQHRVLEAYGAWGEKSMYGRTFQGILRTTVLIGADGRIARIWRNVRVDDHADAVLTAARSLN
jgi:peroxiredoxin Q/BCP